MTLTVDRLRMTVRAREALAPGRLEAWQSALADQDDRAMADGLLHGDEWLLVRHLRVTTRWRADEVDGDVGRHWGAALRRSLEAALASRDDAQCVRYADGLEALADMLYRSALRETQRQWAWQKMGLLSRSPVAAGDALMSAVAALERQPEQVLPVLSRLLAAEAATSAFTALVRALPAAAWSALLRTSPLSARWLQTLPSAMPGPGSAKGGAGSDPPDVGKVPGTAAPLLAWAADQPLLARRHADVLAVLTATWAWPGEGGSGPRALTRLAMLRRRFVGPTPTPPQPPWAGAVTAESRTLRPASADAVPLPAPPPRSEPAPTAAEAPSAPDLPALSEGLPTRFGGTIFWLGRVVEPGLWDWLESQRDGAPAEPLRLWLRALVQALGVPEDDPAAPAFCGGVWPEPEPPPAFVARAQAMVERWAAWLDDAAPELAEPRLQTVCQRRGRLRLAAGWIELRLPMEAVDTAIRRLGLDLDPGWLPWLGCVVRIHYGD